MKNKVIITTGISASGKSTYAKELAVNEGYIRLNRDDFRKSLINTSLKEYWTGDKEYRNKIETLVTQMLNQALKTAIQTGLNVVVDNTHLQPRYITEILKICKDNCGAEGFDYLIKRFDVPTEICIERDKNREDSVGEQVILNQVEQLKKFKYPQCNQWVEYVPYNFEPLVFDQTKTKCLLVDIDNTVAQMVDRSPFDWKRVGEDLPKQQVIDIVKYIVMMDEFWMKPDIQLIFMSGRDAICMTETRAWLEKHFNTTDFELHMRPQNDNRPDTIIKYEILKNEIAPRYNPIAVFDDRNAVIAMERKMGLQVFQCEYGDF